jgi:hypothetical protein
VRKNAAAQAAGVAMAVMAAKLAGRPGMGLGNPIVVREEANPYLPIHTPIDIGGHKQRKAHEKARRKW